MTELKVNEAKLSFTKLCLCPMAGVLSTVGQICKISKVFPFHNFREPGYEALFTLHDSTAGRGVSQSRVDMDVGDMHQ